MLHSVFRYPLHLTLVILSSLHLQTCLNIEINDTNELQPSFYETPVISVLVDEIKIPHTVVPEKEITHTIGSNLISESTSILLSSNEYSFETGFQNSKSTKPLELPVLSTTLPFHHSQIIVKEIADKHVLFHGTKSPTEEISQSHDLSSVLTLDAKLNTNAEINGTITPNTESAALVNVSSEHEIMPTQVMLTFNESGMSLPQSKAESIMNNVERISFISNSSMLLSNIVILPPMKVTKDDLANDTSSLSEDHILHYSTTVIYMLPMSSAAQSQSVSYPSLTEDKLLSNTHIMPTLFPDDLKDNTSSTNIYQVLDETAATSSKNQAKSVSVEIKEQNAFDMESSFTELNQSGYGKHEKADNLKGSVDRSFQSVIDSTILETFASKPQNGIYTEYGENDTSKMTHLLAAIQLLQNSPQDNISLSDMKEIKLLFNRSYHSGANKTSNNMINAINDVMYRVKEQMLADVHHYKNDIPCSIYIPVEKTHQFIVKFMVLQNSSKQADLPRIFEQHLRNVLNDTRCLSVVRLSFSDNIPFIFSWTNSTVNSSVCALNEIHQMTKMMYNSSGVLSQFSEAFLPEFEIVNVRLELLGSCFQMKIGPNIAVIAFSVVCAVSSLPCIAVVIYKLLQISGRLSKLHKNKLRKPRSPAIFKLEKLPKERPPYVYVSRRSRNDEIFMKNFQSAHEVLQISEDSTTNSHISSTPK